MAPTDPCLEFMTTHLVSGTWHSADGSLAPPEFISAPHVPGLHMVYGDVRSSLVQEVLRAGASAGRGQPVHRPASEAVATLDTDGALNLARDANGTVLLPNTGQFDLTNPNFHPVDARVQTDDSGSATHVLVLPPSDLPATFERNAFPLENSPGLVIGNEAMAARVAAANPRFAPDEYPIFMHGSLLAGDPGDLRNTITDVLNGLANDPRAAGQNIVLVACVTAVSPDGLDDAAAELFTRLPAQYPKLTAFPSATMVPLGSDAPAGQLSEVHATTTTMRPDGRMGLTAELIRTYTDAEDAPPGGTGRTPAVSMHAPTLSQARGAGVPVTDRTGNPLEMTDDLASQLRTLGEDTRPYEPAPGSILFAGHRSSRDAYIEEPEDDRPSRHHRSSSNTRHRSRSRTSGSGSSNRDESRRRTDGTSRRAERSDRPPTSNNRFWQQPVAEPPPPPPVDWLAVYRQMLTTSPSRLAQRPVGDQLRDAYDYFMGLSYAQLAGLGSTHPLRVAFDDPDNLIGQIPQGADVLTSFDAFASRMGLYPAMWHDPDIRMAFMNYKRQLIFEIHSKYVLGYTDPDAIRARVNSTFGESQVRRFVRKVAEAGGLSIPYTLWQDNQHLTGSAWRNWVRNTRAQYQNHLALWGKLNPEVADRIARMNGQRILESTLLGSWGDDLLFGFGNYNNGTPGYFDFWADASHYLVDVSGGEIEAHVFEGVMRNGVLDNTEVPALLAKIAAGEITSLKISIWKLRGQVLVHTADIVIHSRASYDSRAPLLDPNAMSKEYWDQQSRLYMQKIYRSQEMASRGYRNSQAPLLLGASGANRRGGVATPAPIFVLNQIHQEIDEILQDGGGTRHPRSNSYYMDMLTAQAQAAPAPVTPPLLPRRAPTGGQNWDNFQGFGAEPEPQPRLRRTSTHIGPNEDRRASADRRTSSSSSSSGSDRGRPPLSSNNSSRSSQRRRSSRTRESSRARQFSAPLVEEPEGFDDLNFGGLSINDNPFMPAPNTSTSFGPVNYGNNPLSRSSDPNAGAYGSPKYYNMGAEVTAEVERPAEVLTPTRLSDRPAALLLGDDASPEKVEANRDLVLPNGTYQFSMEGAPGSGVLNGQKVNARQVAKMILDDERSHDLDITLVQCDPAFPVSNALDSFLADLWREMIADGRWNPERSIIGSVGSASVRPGTDGGPGDVIAVSSTIAPNGSIRLNTGGFRSITGRPGLPPQLTQHGTSLNEAVDEVRNGGGIPLTDDLGNLVPLPRAEFLNRGLNDPVHLRAAVDHQAGQGPSPVPVGEDTAETAPTWNMWMPDNVRELRPGSNVFIVSSQPPPTTAEAEAYYKALEENASPTNPIIDVGVDRNQRIAPEDLGTARLMMEQFAQRNRQAYLSTRGRATEELIEAITPYGAPLIHQTLAKGDLGGFSLGPRFTFTLPRTANQAQIASTITEGVGPGLFERARELAQPTSAVRPVDNQLGQMIWSENLANSREQFRQAAWTADQMTQHLGTVSAMSERVGNLPKIAFMKPVLEFGAVDQADIVFDYGLTSPENRAAQVIGSLGDVQRAGQLGTGAPGSLTFGHFSSMVAASGTDDLSLPTINALDIALANGDLDQALAEYRKYEGKFGVDRKSGMLDKLADLQPLMPERLGDIQRIMQTVLDC